jgi:glutamate-1-semialdehyde 2,1-aminomutase
MRFERSAKALQDGARLMPGGIGSDFRKGMAPTPLVIDHGDGPFLIDIDGNRLLDYYLGMGPMLLGHTPSSVIKAVEAQLGRGILYAAQTDLEYRAAELLIEMIPSAQRVRFGSSGSESVQAALRLARAATGRRRMLKFEGHYHGWFDNVLWSTAGTPEAMGPRDAPTPAPASGGMDLTTEDSVAVLPWNDLALVERRLHEGDIAAVIMEAAMCNTSAIPPAEGYLEGVRRICDETGTILIFDEVITGFRLGAGGAQTRFGVTPDLAVFAKALANGFPVSALVGRADLMDELAGPKNVIQAGTYNGGAVMMAATIACLEVLRDSAVHAQLTTVGTQLMAGIEAALAEHRVRGVVQGWPSIFHVALGTDGPITDYRTARAAHRDAYVLFASEMLKRGVRALERGAWFLSTAHSEMEITATLSVVSEALAVVAQEFPELVVSGAAAEDGPSR